MDSTKFTEFHEEDSTRRNILFKKVCSHYVVENKNLSRFSRKQEFIYSVLPQQHVSGQWAIISLARMED